MKGEVVVKFRAGKKKDDNKPRPMVVKITDDETRARMLNNARRLARDEVWRKVYVAPDMSWEQREEDKKREKELKEKAEAMTGKAVEEGKKGKYKVVGRRGGRRIAWEEDKAGGNGLAD